MLIALSVAMSSYNSIEAEVYTILDVLITALFKQCHERIP